MILAAITPLLVATSTLASAAEVAPAAATRKRPSVLLVVLDTVRADAVSAYGRVDGTTPVLDELARTGLRYEHAYAASSWTVPSHAAMFTGLRPSVTGSLRGGMSLSGRHRTLATAVMLAGYDTAGFAENPWLSAELGFHEGFAHFENLSLPQLWRDSDEVPRKMEERVGGWLRRRDRERPFFVFVNIMDAHDPYPVSADNPFLAPWVPLDDARLAREALPTLQCATDGRQEELHLLHRLYLHGVQLADAKLGRVLEAVRRERPDDELRIIVVSDHGEHFGERRRMLHNVGLGEALIHVPLVIHGAPVTPAVIDTAVPTSDVFGTVISWTGAWASGPGRVLPTRPGGTGPKSAVVAEYEDVRNEVFTREAPMSIMLDTFVRETRLLCRPEDRADGSQRAVVVFPHKLVMTPSLPPELFDLAADPEERRNLSAEHPEIVRELLTQLPPFGTPEAPRAPPIPIIDMRRAEQLRALGYVVTAP
jgi:arylsulfatase A-like enzyme